jgi:diadenosine tetraphosphate (Ap4A) HIT family hydrolase
VNQAFNECTACNIVSGKVIHPGGTIYEDEYWHVDSAGHANIWRGFLMIKLKRHCVHLADLNNQEAAALGGTIQATNQALMAVLHPAKIFLCSFGEGNAHIHFWVLPRPPEMRPGMHPVFFNLDWRLTLTRLFHLKTWLVPDVETARIAGAVRKLMLSPYGHGGAVLQRDTSNAAEF